MNIMGADDDLRDIQGQKWKTMKVVYQGNIGKEK